MARKINDIIKEGNGLRVSWSDGNIDQYIWILENNQLALKGDSGILATDKANEIIDTLAISLPSTSLWSHLFGTAGDHISAAADIQTGDSLVINTWTRCIWDNTSRNT